MPEPLTGPEREPLSLSEAKLFLKVDHDAEDGLVTALVASARRFVEARTGRILIRQTFRLVRDGWPASGIIPLPMAPVSEILAARVRNADGSSTSIQPATFALNAGRAPALLRVDPSRLPRPGVPYDGIEIEVAAGYGDDPADVPADLMEAVRLTLAHAYENRAAPGDPLAFPAALDALLQPYRVVRL